MSLVTQGSNPCVVYWIGFAELVNSVASGFVFAMTMPNIAFDGYS
jgi:hypothetical protein